MKLHIFNMSRTEVLCGSKHAQECVLIDNESFATCSNCLRIWNNTTNVKKITDTLWRELHSAISSASNADTLAGEWSRNDFRLLHRLLAEETSGERQHRRFACGIYPLSSGVGAKVCILANIAEGSKKTAMPPASLFITNRRSYAEAMLLGYCLRASLSAEWIESASKLDYSALMNPKAGA